MMQQETLAFPWVDSYFGIPEPEATDYGLPTSFITVEYEIHILFKDLTVEVHTIRHDRQHQTITKDGRGHLGMFDPQDFSMPLKEKAWGNSDAIAFVIYYSNTSSLTGIKIKSKDKCLCAKVGRFKWKWVYYKDLHGALRQTEYENAFIPDNVKMKNPQAFR
ncbi:hypothetical protein GU926_01910 [Nibribacter ruber]|uniref:Uncharacterized protein n=1 Tax=Nibribacter ruber TaxID=2698458 RepID=A0A6P1NWT9_9BACT|nr:hypothetical protein [Nibribacter ruber]QHL86265.1 hypothetical protein GU926_01910 [Nibribacter ruber]